MIWSAFHHYLGLGGDARLYAVQAFARIHRNLAGDIYLQNSSQDSYTIFSSLYATCVGLIGLREAGLTLAIVFKSLFFAATWALARRLNGASPFLAVALVIITTGGYGAFEVFHYGEDWLTARSAAEALVIASIASYFYGSRSLALLIACAAMLVHPIIALPGLLLLICLWLPLRGSVIGTVAAILLTFCVALLASSRPWAGRVLAVMDSSWLEVVRERSQFLFPQLWRAADWSLNARPFLSLCLSALAINDGRVRSLCAAAALVGAAGLAVGLIAGCVGPVSLLLQGQAWRWAWITVFASVLLLAPTIRAMWRAKTACGPVCVALMICAWAFPPMTGTVCLSCAMILWLVRDTIKIRAALELRQRIELLLFSIGATLAHWIQPHRSALSTLAVAVLLTACFYNLPRALRDTSSVGTAAEVDQYSDWRQAIPPDANVLVLPAHNSAAFAWFTLQRPSYLTVDQSSGVVFSRDTALEIRRRSQVLLPVMDPDWRLLSDRQPRRGSNGQTAASTRPLTRDRLLSICTDLQLDFVVAVQNVGFDPIGHALSGNGQNWYLYDCRPVRSETPA